MEAILTAVGSLSSLAAEYASATEERRAQIRAACDAAYHSYSESLAGLPAALHAHDVAADAAAAMLPSEKPAPPPPPIMTPPTGGTPT